MKKFEILDKRSRTSIMYGVIICLSIAILFCIVKIATRPKVTRQDTFYIDVKEKIDPDDYEAQIAARQETVNIVVEDRARLIEDNVNIRSGPGTDTERLGSAYKGFDYKILENTGGDWIKIEYDGRAAYVFAEYVEVVPMFLNDMGEYEEYVTMDESTSKSTGNSSDTEDSTDETSDTENATDSED